ncbi:hypothetical protein E2C01_070535 [Portunus trituberculatus]|uniref:Uncharacterized protein n=1 Tax=Portunus trituberculatus TaxID=210409 RepID=A0A5B7HUE2_PORTR|nr:hypothetical protein [Portunus trituberculatus]
MSGDNTVNPGVGGAESRSLITGVHRVSARRLVAVWPALCGLRGGPVVGGVVATSLAALWQKWW